MDFGPGNRIDLLEVHTLHLDLRLACPLSQVIGPLDRDLQPTAVRTAQVDNECTWYKKAELIVQFLYLISRPAPITVSLRAFHVRIV